MSEEHINPIRSDYLSGMSYVDIGKKHGIDPRTAKRYALNNLPCEYLDQRPFPSILDQYKPIINTWLQKGRLPSTVIHDRLLEMDCECGYTIVNDYVQKMVQDYEKAGYYSFDACSKGLTKAHSSLSFKESQNKKISEEKLKINQNRRQNNVNNT